MVGVAEAGGGTGAAPEPYYGEYYPPATDHYYVTPDMCPHPQHPQHPHMCTVHSDYGGVGMGVVAGGGVNMLPPMMPPVLDESMRHYMLPPPHPPHAPPHHPPPPHQQHHQPHHYAGTNGSGPQQYYGGAGFPAPPPGHYHHVPPHHLQPSPPPPLYHKDERTQRQYTKLKRRLDQKYSTRNNGIDVRSGGSTPSLSPRKESLNGNGGASSGAWSEGEGSSAGASVQGDDDDTQTQLDALSAERTPQVSEITPTSALVQWNSPTPEGVTLPNMELTYELLLGDRDRYKAIYSGPSLSCRVRDLRPGTEYSLRLQIRAGGLTGAASGAATFRAPPAAPAPPPPPRITQRTRSTLLLRWNTSNENGSRIIHYVVEMDSGAGYVEIAQPRTRQLTANNLQQQTEHRFRIAAVNEVGRSEWSEETVEWTAGTPPTAPAPPTLAEATNVSLHLVWQRRTPNEEFTLQMDDRAAGHGFLPVYSGRDLSHTCEGLRRSSDYYFRLRCETADGNGPWSTEVTYCTAPERPGPPGRPSTKGKIHSRALRLKWDPPADDGGSQVRSYLLELDGGEGVKQTYSAAEREAYCDRLQPGMSYRARVNCSTDAGTSDWSTAETVTTDAVCPAACSAPELTAKPRATSVAVRWREPETDGGSPITEYRLELYQPSGDTIVAYAGLDLECIVRDLTPGTDYKLQVFAHNKMGASAASATLAVLTAAAPPDSPEPPTVTIEDPMCVALEWSAPCGNGAAIIDYRVEVSSSEVDDGYMEIYRGNGTSYTYNKLIPSSPYFFRVCASNMAGRSVWSRVTAVVTPRAPPAAPVNVRYESTAISLELSWRKPIDHGAEIVRYIIEIYGTVYETDKPVCSYTVEGLSPDTSYIVRIAAVNELGTGAWSEATKTMTRPPPPAPPRLECAQRAHNFLKIKWGEGVAPETTQYLLEMRVPELRDFRPAYRGSARFCKVKKLRESSKYCFRIRANDELGGRGQFSEVLEVATVAAPPPAPRVPIVEMISARTASVNWEALEPGMTYIVQTGRGKEPSVWKQAYAGEGTSTELEELEVGAEYSVRLCGMRKGLQGVWSNAARVVVPLPPPLQPAAPRARRTRASRNFLERHTVWVYIAGFLVVAVMTAILLERLVDSKRSSGP